MSVPQAIDFLKLINDQDVASSLKFLNEYDGNGLDIPRFTYMLVDILKEVIVFNKTDSTENLALLHEDNVYEVADFIDSKTAFE